ncbi:MAG TPA: ATP-binding cassette domain-containing protein, partial [Clostridia bacterium]|nr:ATP-binding cassette domain-containing protein [Clostridia bacterium]
MEETAATTARVLEASGISKTFPGVKALEDVSLTLNKGEVLSLVGENGAGKSTLTKVLSGLYRTDHGVGSIKLNGELVHFQNAKEAKDHGLITIFQELSLVKGLTVAENVFLGNLPRTKFNLIDWHTLREKTRNILAEMGLDISPDELAGDLSISKQQMVEIARAFTLGARVLIFDEPTSSLTETEKEILFKIIHTLREKGVGIIYITHKMDEVFEISDRITVLRDGKNSGDLNTATAKLDDIISLMIGRVIDDYFHKNEAEKG